MRDENEFGEQYTRGGEISAKSDLKKALKSAKKRKISAKKAIFPVPGESGENA